MSTPAFKDALRFTLPWEGGYVNDPDDSGGATNKGITQVTYNAWRTSKGWPTRSVRLITDGEVEAIYEERFWNKTACSQLDDLLAIAAFDFGVNSGPARAIRFLQEAVGARGDGVWGPKSAAALRAAIERHGGGRAGVTSVTAAYIDSRERFVREVARRRPKDRKHLGGWLNRLNSLRKRVGVVTRPVE